MAGDYVERRPSGGEAAAPSGSPLDLHAVLVDRLDVEELRTLCFGLGVEYDDLRGEGLAGKARELILLLQRRGKMPQLVEWLRRERPDIAF